VTPDLGYKYKRWGAVHKIEDITGTRLFTYRSSVDLQMENEHGSSADVPAGGFAIPRKSFLSYDSRGRLYHHRVTTPDGIGADHVVQYAYNSQTGRLSSVTHGDPAYGSQYRQFGQSYVPNSHLPATKGSTYLPQTTYEWDPYRDTLKSITQAVGGQGTNVWAKVEYGDVGNPLDAVNNIGQRRKATYSGSIYTGSNAPQPNTADYTYNDNGEVEGETRTGSQSNVIAERGFFYDPIGNRTQAIVSGSATTLYEPNALNQYSQITVGAGTPSNPAHDLDGNLVNDGTKVYVWDAENRLSEVRRATDNALIATYRYDYMSRRIRQDDHIPRPAPGRGGPRLRLRRLEPPLRIRGFQRPARPRPRLHLGPGPQRHPPGSGRRRRTALRRREGRRSVHSPLYDGNGNVLGLDPRHGLDRQRSSAPPTTTTPSATPPSRTKAGRWRTRSGSQRSISTRKRGSITTGTGFTIR
jgi:hypothetical protein